MAITKKEKQKLEEKYLSQKTPYDDFIKHQIELIGELETATTNARILLDNLRDLATKFALDKTEK